MGRVVRTPRSLTIRERWVYTRNKVHRASSRCAACLIYSGLRRLLRYRTPIPHRRFARKLRKIEPIDLVGPHPFNHKLHPSRSLTAPHCAFHWIQCPVSRGFQPFLGLCDRQRTTAMQFAWCDKMSDTHAIGKFPVGDSFTIDHQIERHKRFMQ